MTIDYGFETTDNIELPTYGLPLGEYTVMAKEEEGKPYGVLVTFEILDGEFKGRTHEEKYQTKFESDDLPPEKQKQVRDIAQANIKRIAEATGRAISGLAPIKGRVFKIIVDKQKKNPLYTTIVKYEPADVNAAPAPAAKSDAPF